MFNLLFLLVVLTITNAHAVTGEFPVALSVIKAAPETNIETIVQYPFRQLDSTSFSAGYTRETHWFKIDLLAPTSSLDSLILTVHPTYLDNLVFYYQNAQQEWVTTEMGDQLPFALRPIPYRGFAIAVPTQTLMPQSSVYVRLNTTSSSVFNITAWSSYPSFQQHASLENIVIGIYLGIILLLLILNMGVIIHTKDRQLIYYQFYLASSGLLIGATNGVFGQFVFPEQPIASDTLTSLGVAAVYISASLFYQRLMWSEKGGSRVLRGLNTAVFLVFMAIPVAIMLHYFTEWMTITINVMLFAILLWLGRSIYLWAYQGASALLIFAHVMTLFGGVAASLALNGWLENAGFWLVNGFQVGMLATITALQIIMIRRVIKMDNDRLVAEARADEMQTALHQQESMLSMLTHEVKTPLSVVSIALQSSNPSQRLLNNAFDAIDNITDIIDRCVTSQLLKHQKYPLKIQSVDLVALIKRVSMSKSSFSFVDIETPWSEHVIQSDDTYLSLIVLNFLDNAIKYRVKDSPVKLILSAIDGQLCIDVVNEVNPNHLPDEHRLYEQFYRAPEAQRVTGAGLGLFIVKMLADAISASIHYQVVEGKYVMFRVCMATNPTL